MSETKTKNLCTVPAADLTDSQYFIAEDGGELKRIPKAQVVLKKLENMLATDTENLAGGGEVTAQELLDALAEQVANKLLAKSQVVNNLLATVEGNPLDATQGKALKELIDTTNNNLSKRFAAATSGNTYNALSDFPETGSGFGVTTTGLTLYDGFKIPAYSRICFMNYGDSKDGAIFAIDGDGKSYTAFRNNGTWHVGNCLSTKDDLPNMFSSTVPTDWTNINNDNAPLSIWNIGTEGTWFKGAPDGAYKYGTLIFLGGNLNKGDWRNVLIYIPDIVAEKSIYVRNERGSTWLKLTGTTVNSVT